MKEKPDEGLSQICCQREHQHFFSSCTSPAYWYMYMYIYIYIYIYVYIYIYIYIYIYDTEGGVIG